MIILKILGYIILAIVLIFILLMIHGYLKTICEEKARKQKDPDNILPNWFDGEIYDEGEEVVSRNSGKSILLDKYELTMYDFIMGINYMGDHRGWKNEMIELVEKCQNWFKEKNPKAHKILFQSDISPSKEAADEPDKEQKLQHHLQWLLKRIEELSDEIPLENQLKKNEKITVTLDNWLGTVSFKTTREKLYQLKVYLDDAGEEIVTSAPDYESISWEELRINNEFIIDGNVGITGCCDPYLIFEPKGQFLVVDRWEISGESFGTHNGDGYSFEFINCKAPAKLEKYLFNQWMFFSVSDRALTKERDLKTMKRIYKDTNDAYVSNDGSATIRLQDFDIDKFFNDRGISYFT